MKISPTWLREFVDLKVDSKQLAEDLTAAGLAVAIPAVLGYNVYGRLIGRIEADLEGFARDLRELLTHGKRAAPASKEA